MFIVVETLACRMSFCCTPIGVPVSSNNERYVCLKVCQTVTIHADALAFRFENLCWTMPAWKQPPVTEGKTSPSFLSPLQLSRLQRTQDQAEPRLETFLS